MSTKVFINLPVRDLDQSKAFFGGLGFTFNPQFSDDNAACMVISEHNFAMLLKRDYFGTFATKTRAARTGTNPSTGKPINIPKRTYVRFSPGKTLKERVEK